MFKKQLSTNSKIAIAVIALLSLFGLMNIGYLWVNLKYIFIYPDTKVQSQSFKQNNNIEPEQNNFQVKSQANFFQIKSLGIKAPIIYPVEASETVYQEALKNGVAHFPGTAQPGELGNCYIFGHSSDYLLSKGKYKNIFALLPKIKIGEEIIISDSEREKHIYIVLASRKISHDDVSVLDQQNYKKKLLTLQTSYPLGTALARWVAIAEKKD